ncbi:MAG: hypothetical protein B7Z33_00795 [Sphingomonadales bacterium 12-68-11]|nr:MAG: hypothetical protein B7Z33_00795 [Sphingomonadales bacterium 12-68-11]OYX16946.1 MAG: hypothetical protein B7Z07_01470 [Sphingomonadales bacterium 32-67-7]
MDKPDPIPPPPAKSGFQLNGPTVIGALYLATYFTVFSALVGVVLAYVWRRRDDQEWTASHYTYQIRTFWIGLGAAVVGLVLAVTLGLSLENRGSGGVGIAALAALALLVIVGAVLLIARCALSLVNAQQQVPMPNPRSWTI